MQHWPLPLRVLIFAFLLLLPCLLLDALFRLGGRRQRHIGYWIEGTAKDAHWTAQLRLAVYLILWLVGAAMLDYLTWHTGQ